MLKLNTSLSLLGALILLAAWACDAENDQTQLHQASPKRAEPVLLKATENQGLACIYASTPEGEFELLTKAGAISDESIIKALPKEEKDHYQIVFNPLDPNKNRINFIRAGISLKALIKGVQLHAEESQGIVKTISDIAEHHSAS